MTDSIESRARLARNNINILGIDATIHYQRIIYEFQYRLPTTRQTVWHKTISDWIPREEDPSQQVLDEVRALRRELEHDD